MNYREEILKYEDDNGAICLDIVSDNLDKIESDIWEIENALEGINGLGEIDDIKEMIQKLSKNIR